MTQHHSKNNSNSAVPSSPTATRRIAEAIRLVMASRQMTDVELAKKTGIPRTTVRTYIGGTLKAMDLGKLERIAHALDQSLSDLLVLSEGMRGFMKRETPAGKYDLINMGKDKVRIALDSPTNPYHAHGTITFQPGSQYAKNKESETDIWIYLKSEGGIITLDYNHESHDIKGGDRIVFNGRHPFSLRYLTDDRNKRHLGEPDISKRQILLSFSSTPPFWMY